MRNMENGTFIKRLIAVLFLAVSVNVSRQQNSEISEDSYYDTYIYDYSEDGEILRSEDGQRFRCNDSENKTIPISWRCDQELDCSNGMDEQMSTCNKTKCADDEWECGSLGICILATWRCDGANDCINFEDEEDCNETDIEIVTIEVNEQVVICGTNNSWTCLESTVECIERYAVCDGVIDCTDGSDETKDTCQDSIACEGEYTACFSPTTCIPNFWKCDGRNDCSDGSDEIDCIDESLKANHTCPDRKIACIGVFMQERCLPLAEQCDGVSDCQNDEDEGKGCSIMCQQVEGGTNNTCSHICHRTPHGPVCSCKEGYRLLEDNRTCADIDECSFSTAECEQLCVNTQGSYECQCVDGFGLTSDKTRCKAHGRDRTYLFFGNGHEIRRITLLPLEEGRINGTRHFLRYELIDGLNISTDAIVTDVDYLYNTSSLFWLEKQDALTTLKYKDGEGKIVQLIKAGSSFELQRISIDWIGMNVFFTAKNTTQDLDGGSCDYCGHVGLVPMSESNDNRLESHGIADYLGNVMDILVIAHKGVVFTTEYAVRGKILAIATDGSDIKVLKKNVMRPNALTYDDTTNRLFWSQAPPLTWSNRDNDFQIRAMSLSDNTERMILSREHPYFYAAGSIAYFENRIRWYDISRNEIVSAAVKDGKNSVVLAKFHFQNKTDHSPVPLQISHPALQRERREGSELFADI